MSVEKIFMNAKLEQNVSIKKERMLVYVKVDTSGMEYFVRVRNFLFKRMFKKIIIYRC
jgi:hypothetical protein